MLVSKRIIRIVFFKNIKNAKKVDYRITHHNHPPTPTYANKTKPHSFNFEYLCFRFGESSSRFRDNCNKVTIHSIINQLIRKAGKIFLQLAETLVTIRQHGQAE